MESVDSRRGKPNDPIYLIGFIGVIGLMEDEIRSVLYSSIASSIVFVSVGYQILFLIKQNYFI
jgi:hypothetical protein